MYFGLLVKIRLIAPCMSVLYSLSFTKAHRYTEPSALFFTNICIFPLIRLYFGVQNTCMDCHPECRDSCSGPNSDNCTACANVKDGRFCLNKCPEAKYPARGICEQCHETCVGCKGPRNTIASDGCITCDSAIINGDQKVERCLKKDEPCPGKK